MMEQSGPPSEQVLALKEVQGSETETMSLSSGSLSGK